MKLYKRNTGLDIIRCVALFCVIAIHFFLYTDFYQQTVSGPLMLIMVIMRNSFLICVPLFLMLTGYLIHSKEISLRYYSKLTRIIFVYVAASIFCGLYSRYVIRTGLSYASMILNIFSFRTADYSWYVEMYIGLFLMIPFLNIIYDALPTKQNRQALLLTFLFLTALPSIFNIYRIAGLDWWLRPSTSSNYFPLVPAWWMGMYPITYFYWGRYLKDYPITIKPAAKVLLAVIIFIFAGLFNYYRSYENTFVNGLWNDHGSILITLQSVLVFSLLADLNYDKMPLSVKRIAAAVSELSLGAYLTSWVFDMDVYYKLTQLVPTMERRLLCFPIAVTAILLGSLCLSAIIQVLYKQFQKLLRILPRAKKVNP